MKHLISLIALLALASCATVEDRDCRRASDILNDANYYDVCLTQKRVKWEAE
jgi:hypothetical protein